MAPKTEQVWRWLEALAEELKNKQETLAAIMMFETGKLRAAVEMEIAGTVHSLTYWTQQRLDTVKLEEGEHHVLEQNFAPQGVVVAITPANMPLIMMINKLAPALIAGNAIICKPSPQATLTSLFLAKILHDIMPEGIVNIVTGDAAGPELATAKETRMISFTGSVGVGKQIMQTAATDLKRLQLELGGNDPAIVLPDANLETVVPQIFRSAFGSAGQACVAVKRVYVHSLIYDDFTKRMIEYCQQAQSGSPFSSDTTIPPLMTEAQLTRMHSLLQDAIRQGATVHPPNVKDPSGGFFAQPRIVTDTPWHTDLVEDEQFSPVLPLLVYDDTQEVLDHVNEGQFGLGTTIWTNDHQAAADIARQVESGMVWINEIGPPSPAVPFGGVKSSGLGREGGAMGLASYAESKVVRTRK